MTSDDLFILDDNSTVQIQKTVTAWKKQLLPCGFALQYECGITVINTALFSSLLMILSRWWDQVDWWV